MAPLLSTNGDAVTLACARGGGNGGVELDFNGRRAITKLRTIEHLPSLPSLLRLDLSCHAIERIQNLERGVLLQDLNLAGNRILRVEHLDRLTGLVRLNLSRNRIARIPESIAVLQRLQELRLEDNALSVLNDVRYLRPMVNLTNLVLQGNPVAALAHYRSFVV